MAVYCSRNHAMTFHTVPPNFRYNNGAYCDNCRCQIPMYQGFHHCETCTFDLCGRCKSLPNFFKRIEAANLAALPCSNGHPMDLLTATPSYYAGGVKCNVCLRSIDVPQQGFRHCAACKFDLCAQCCRNAAARGAGTISNTVRQFPQTYCRSGHTMTQLTSSPPTYIALGGVRCDNCRASVTCSDGFRHCADCRFDLCARCVYQPQFQQRGPASTLATSAVTLPATYCRSNHVMEVRTTPPSHPGYLFGVKCDNCRNSIQESTTMRQGFRHCSVCNFDLCATCTRVPRYQQPSTATTTPTTTTTGGGVPVVRGTVIPGSDRPRYCTRRHRMSCLTVLPPEYLMGASSGAICDSCRSVIVPDSGFHHCDTCSFDLCGNCVTDPIFASPDTAATFQPGEGNDEEDDFIRFLELARQQQQQQEQEQQLLRQQMQQMERRTQQQQPSSTNKNNPSTTATTVGGGGGGDARHIEAPQCCICLEYNADHILIPCGHICVCSADAHIITSNAKNTARCPTCQQIVESCHKVFGLN